MEPIKIKWYIQSEPGRAEAAVWNLRNDSDGL